MDLAFCRCLALSLSFPIVIAAGDVGEDFRRLAGLEEAGFSSEADEGPGGDVYDCFAVGSVLFCGKE